VTGDLVNLRRARKAKARAQAAAEAEVNRRAFGRAKAERTRTGAERDLDNRRLDGHVLSGAEAPPTRDD
jgi:Domain of unknown function (DUF4169)